MSKPIEIGVDTNVLLDLADDNEVVIDCIEIIRKRIPDSRFVILPTVIQELTDIYLSEEIAERALAQRAIQNIRGSWNFIPVNCIPVGHAIVEQIGNKIRAKGLIPPEEIHDSFIVAEAALREVTILLSSDRHIKEIDSNALKVLLDTCDVGCPLIFSPYKIVKNFFV